MDQQGQQAPFDPARLQQSIVQQQQLEQQFPQPGNSDIQFDPAELQKRLSGNTTTTSENDNVTVSPIPPQQNTTPSSPPSAPSDTSQYKGASGLLGDFWNAATSKDSDVKWPDSDEAVMARNSQVVQQTNSAINSALTKQGLTNTPQLGDEDVGNFTRTKIGLADTFTGKYNAFKQSYPKGDMREVNDRGQNILVFTPDATDKSLPWARLTPTIEEAANKYFEDQRNPNLNEAQKLASSMMLIGKVLEDNSNEAATTAVLTFLTGGGGLARQGASLVGKGALAKVGIHSGLEGSGINTGESMYDSAKKGIIEGAEALASLGVIKGIMAAPNAVMAAGQKALKVASGSGVFKISPEAQEARDAMERLKDAAIKAGADPKVIDAIGYMPNQLVDLPMLERWSKQTQSLLGRIGNYLQIQKTFVSDQVKRMINPEDLNKAITRGTATENAGLNTAKEIGPTNPNISFKQAGDVYSSDLAGYADRSQKQVSDLYKARDKILTDAGQQPQYDPQAALDAVTKAERGTPMPTRDEEGKLVVNQIEPLSPDAQRIADQIKLWSKSPPEPITDSSGHTTTVADQIQALQRQLFDLARPDASGAIRLDESRAQMMRNGLQQMLDNPTNDVPGFTEANKAAKEAARIRFENLDDPIIRRGNRQDLDEILTTPESSLQTIGAPTGRQVSQLDRLKKVMLPENYETVIQAYRSNLLNDMDKLSSNLDKMNPEIKSRLFPDEATAQAYKDLGDTWKQIKDVGIGKTADASRNANPDYQRQTGARFLDQLLQNKDTTQLQTLENLVRSNPDNQFIQSIRTGLLQHLATQSLATFRGATSIDAKAFQGILDKYDYQTLGRFLSDGDKQLLKDINTTAQWIERNGGGGDALVGAEKASDVLHLKSSVLQTLVEHWWIGKRFTSVNYQKFFYGQPGDTKTPLQKLLDSAAEGLSGRLPTDFPTALKKALILANPVEDYDSTHNVTGDTNTNTSNIRSTYTNADEQTKKALGK